MGNSITEHWSTYSPEFFADKPWVNKGISGQVSWEMLNRFQTDVIDLDPELVIIMAGTNDIAGNQGPATREEIAGNITGMIDMAKAAGIDVILCSVPPAADFPWNPGTSPSTRIPALNVWLMEYAEENGIIYADYFTAMANTGNGMRDGLAYDGVHPNESGYAVMEGIIKAAIGKIK